MAHARDPRRPDLRAGAGDHDRPYRALHPDLVQNEIAGRAQSTQALFRGLGTFLAPLGGGLLIAFGGGVTMSLPYALLMPMMPAGAHGAVTGLYSLSRGLGISLGPLLGVVAIQSAGEDYRWVWLVCAAAILLSILAMYPLRDDEA